MHRINSIQEGNEDDGTEDFPPVDLSFDSFSQQHTMLLESRASGSSPASRDYPSSPFVFGSREIQATVVSVPSDRRVRECFSVKEFIERSEDFATSLRDLAAIKLGDFKIPDSDAAKVFGTNNMLTRGFPTLYDINWKQHWKERIKNTKENKWFTLAPDEWSEEVKVGAYAVNIRNIADRSNGALLSVLLTKTKSGALSRHIWEFPVIEAVINYHWQTWAYTYLFVQLCLFAIWTATFVFYLVFYIQYNLEDILDNIRSGNQENENDEDYNPHVFRFTYLLNTLCLCLMLPFAYIEFITLKKQKERWIQTRNTMDMTVIVLQFFFCICHYKNYGIGEEWYSALLTFHTVLMFIKLLDYGRVLGLGTDFVEAFLYVLYDVRYFILFIITSVIGTGLCLATLYRGDKTTEFDDDGGCDSKKNTMNDLIVTNKVGTSRSGGGSGRAPKGNSQNSRADFSTVPKSLLTAWSIMFGQFETDYVFQADSPWLKGVFFFMFQMVMTVTTLNLLIAVMTQSYSKFIEDRSVRYNISRASVIDELQVIKVPRFFNKNLDPYIHFLIVEPNPESSNMFPIRHSINPTNSVEDLRKEVAAISQSLQSVLKHLERIQQESASRAVSPQAETRS